MHIQNDPSFFLTNKTGAPQGEELGLIKPLSDSSFSYSDNSFISEVYSEVWVVVKRWLMREREGYFYSLRADGLLKLHFVAFGEHMEIIGDNWHLANRGLDPRLVLSSPDSVCRLRQCSASVLVVVVGGSYHLASLV
ncbi:hypothetical protein Tco_0164500 [Tanacetum coccineum]